MSSIKTYPNRKAAQAEIATMRGWDAKPVQLCIPSDANADENGDVWVIAVVQGNSDEMYMREDGTVA